MTAAATGDWPAAETALRSALETLEAERRTTPTPIDRATDDDARLAAVAGNLGVVLLEQRRIDEARAQLERALAIRRTVLEPGDPLIAESLGNLGELERRAGRPGRAQPLHEEALAIRLETLEPGHPDIALSRANLGVTLYDLGAFQAAAGELEAALESRRERLGPAHPATLETAASLVAAAFALDDLALAERALADLVAADGADAVTMGGGGAAALRSLVELRLRQGDGDAAVLLCEDRVLDRQPPGDRASIDLPTAELLGACADTLRQVGATARAIGFLELWLGDAGRPPTAAVEAELRWSVAETRLAAGELEAAETALSRVVELLETADDPRLAVALNNLGALRFERGRPIEAAGDLEAALAMLDEGPQGDDLALLRDLLANYAIVLRTLDRHDEASAVEARLIDLATEPAIPEPAAGD